MPQDAPSTEQLNACSSALVNLVLDGLKTDRGVHLETALWAMGSLAGLAMLRDTGIDVSALPAGQVVLVDAVNDSGSKLMGELGEFCKASGIDPNTGWVDEIAPDHQSHFSTVDLNAKFEPLALAAYEANSVPSSSRAMVTGLAAIRLLHMGAQALNPEIGKAVLINAIQTGAKTVPA
jgi:hypothetical protein